MSGLAFLWNLDGKPAIEADLDSILAEMARRGPDREVRAIDGPVAIGHRLLASTPSSAREVMPLQDPDTQCWITGQIRIDNRDDLIAVLSCSHNTQSMGDGALVLEAWKRWGRSCVEWLLGDFAFVIWDPRRQRVFAARDHTGMRPIIYTIRPGRVFVCASSAVAVARAPRIEGRIRPVALAKALMGYEYFSLTDTQFVDVLRLEPGCTLEFDGRYACVRRYWQMDSGSKLKLRDNREYSDAFWDVLAKCVRVRLQGFDTLGSMLSGGMDSGSIVAVAQNFTSAPLRTYSCVAQASQVANERAAILAVSQILRVTPTILDCSDCEEWIEELAAQISQIEDPNDLGMAVPGACYLAAKRDGLKTVLDGVAGDVFLSEGPGYMAHLLLSGRWLQAWQHASRSYRRWGPEHEAHPLLQVKRGVGWALSHQLKWRSPTPVRLGALPESMVLTPEFAVSSGLADERRQYENLINSEISEAGLSLTGMMSIVVARERYDRVAAYHGVEPRDPYMDRRMVEFCLSLPQHQLAAQGYSKIIQRRAMQGVLPDEVLWPKGIEHPGWLFLEKVIERWSGLPDLASRMLPRLSRFVRADAIEAIRDGVDVRRIPDNEIEFAFATGVVLDRLSDMGFVVQE